MTESDELRSQLPPELSADVVSEVGPMPDAFDETYRDGEGMPEMCEPQRCLQHLEMGALNALLSWAELARPLIQKPGAAEGESADEDIKLADPLGGPDNPAVSRSVLSVRMPGEAAERLYWWQHAAVGSVATRLRGRFSYHDTGEKVHSFCNVQQHGLPLRLPGSEEPAEASDGGRHVHVAVGFVDLGELAETLLASGTGEEGGGGGLLLWHGYEAGGHACAHTLVIIQMLRADAPTDSIVQVWYSAAWSGKTLSHFRDGVAAVLAMDADQVYSRSVRHWLEAWSGAQVPLANARREWLARQRKSAANIANALHAADRHALCSYRLTGQLLEGSTGSVPMFELPQRVDYMPDDDILRTVPPRALMQRYHALADGERTLLRAGVDVARRRVQALKAGLSAGTLAVQVHHAMLSPTDAEGIATVRALEPDSISWSNIADYMMPQAFHHLARGCSLPHTRHFMHTMNWVTDVKGAYVLDYCDMPQSSDLMVEQRVRFAAEADEGVERMLAEVGAEGVLRHRPLDVRMNVTDSLLVRKVYGRWLDAFTAKAPCGTDVSVDVLQEPAYWFFRKASSVFHVELRYS